MQKTTNYNLNKPDGNDFVKVEFLNENADIIDAAMNDLEYAVNNIDFSGMEQDIGNVSTKVDGVKTVTDATKTVVDATKTKVDTLDTRTSSMASTINAVSTNVSTVNTNVSTINTNVNNLLNGRVVKSVQRGKVSASITQNQTHSIPLSTINATKSVYSIDISDHSIIELGLTNNALTIKNLSQNSTVTVTTHWQVIEFY